MTWGQYLFGDQTITPSAAARALGEQRRRVERAQSAKLAQLKAEVAAGGIPAWEWR